MGCNEGSHAHRLGPAWFDIPPVPKEGVSGLPYQLTQSVEGRGEWWGLKAVSSQTPEIESDSITHDLYQI